MLWDAPMGTCPACWHSGTVVPLGRRPYAAIDHVPAVATARDLVKAAWSVLGSRAYPALVFGRGCFGVVVGPPGSGKSTMSHKLQAGMPGPHVYVSFEEGVGPTVSQRLSRVGVHGADYVVIGSASVDQITSIARDLKARTMCIDSMQRSLFTAREARHLCNVLGLDVLLGVSQVNAEGRAAGRRELEHEADLVVSVDAMHWRVDKSRYAPVGLEGEV